MSTQEFEEVSTLSNDAEENNDCAVKAVSIATGIDYNMVHAIFNKFGRKDGGGSPRHITESVIEFFNFLQVEDDSFSARTIRTLGRQLPPHGSYLVFVRGHVACAKDGRIHDWTSGRQHRIVRIVRLIDCN